MLGVPVRRVKTLVRVTPASSDSAPRCESPRFHSGVPRRSVSRRAVREGAASWSNGSVQPTLNGSALFTARTDRLGGSSGTLICAQLVCQESGGRIHVHRLAE